MSAAGPLYRTFKVTSGAIYGGVPQKVLSFMLESILKPKSIILILFLSSTKIFSNFKSLWHIFF
jgi:hypothetical protein